MPHYSDHILTTITIQRVSDGSRFYPGVPNTSTPFVYNGSLSQLQEMLDSGNYQIVSGANTLKVVTNDLVPQAGTDLELDGRIQNFLGKYYTGGAVPNAPTSVTAIAGNNQVVVSWSASSGATAYNVKRSTVSGSEVTLAAGSNINALTLTDTTAVNGTLYYYEVSALNTNGESVNSSEVSATPTTTPTTQTAIFTGAGPAKLPNFSDGSKWFSSNSLGVLSGNAFTIPLSNKGNIEPSAMWHECNFSDGTIVAGVTTSVDSGILFRYSDPLNMWATMVYNGQQRIYKIQNGVPSVFHDMTLALNPDGSNIKIEMDGANVSFYVIDMTTPIYTFTDAFNQTATKHGLVALSNNFVPAYNAWSATPKAGASYIASSYNPLSNPLYTYIGNSLICGVRGTNYSNSIPVLVSGLFGNNVSFYNDGQSGADSSQILASYSSRSGVLYDSAYPKGVAFVWELTNTLNNGGTASQATTDYQNLLLAVKASGWKTYAGTCLPRGTITSGSYNQTTFETARATCNTNLRSWWSGHIDGIVDFDTVAIGQPNAYNDNTLYYSDLTHLIDAGYSQAATLVYNVIKNA